MRESESKAGRPREEREGREEKKRRWLYLPLSHARSKGKSGVWRGGEGRWGDSSLSSICFRGWGRGRKGRGRAHGICFNENPGRAKRLQASWKLKKGWPIHLIQADFGPLRFYHARLSLLPSIYFSLYLSNPSLALNSFYLISGFLSLLSLFHSFSLSFSVR